MTRDRSAIAFAIAITAASAQPLAPKMWPENEVSPANQNGKLWAEEAAQPPSNADYWPRLWERIYRSTRNRISAQSFGSWGTLPTVNGCLRRASRCVPSRRPATLFPKAMHFVVVSRVIISYRP